MCAKALVAAIGVFLVLSCTATAQANQGFGNPFVIGPIDAIQPSIAFDSRGNAVAAWVEACNWVVAAYQPVGGEFGPTQRLARGSDRDDTCVQTGGPKVAFDAAGNAYITWSFSNEKRVKLVMRSAAGSYSEPQAIGGSVSNAFGWDFEVGPAGLAALAYVPPNGAGPQPVNAVVRPPGGDFGQPHALDGPPPNGYPAGWCSDEGPRVSVGGGTIAVSWDRVGCGPRVAVKPAGSDWTPAFELEKTEGPMYPGVAVDSHGGVLVAWPSGPHLRTSIRPAGSSSTFDTPQDLGDDQGRVTGSYFTVPLSLAFDAAGNATVLFRKYDQNSYDDSSSGARVYAAERSAGGAFGDPVALNSAGQATDDTQLAVAPNGNAVALWRTFDGPVNYESGGGGPPIVIGAVQYALRSSGTWGAPQVLAPTHAIQPAVAYGPKTAIAVWGHAFGNGCNALYDGSCECSQIEASVLGAAAGGISEPGRVCEKPLLIYGLGRQQVTQSDTVKVSVSCTENCTGTASSTLILTASGQVRSSRAISLGDLDFRASLGHPAKLKIKLRKKVLKTVRRALKHHRRAKVIVHASGYDAANHHAAMKIAVRLVR